MNYKWAFAGTLSISLLKIISTPSACAAPVTIISSNSGTTVHLANYSVAYHYIFNQVTAQWTNATSGAYIEYQVNAPFAGKYQMWIDSATIATGKAITVAVNGTSEGQVSVIKTASFSTFMRDNGLNFNLPEGNSTIRLSPTGALNIGRIGINPMGILSLKELDIGNVGAVGHIGVLTTGSSFISGAGSNPELVLTGSTSSPTTPSTTDNLHFGYEMISSDAEMSTRILGFSGTNLDPFARAGIYLRQNLNSNSVSASITATAKEGLLFEYRTSAGADLTRVVKFNNTSPVWIKLAWKMGNCIVSSSQDGTSFVEIDRVPLNLTYPVYLGLGATSNQKSVVMNANLDLSLLAVNPHEQAIAAENFIDSIGVNTHLGYTSTIYATDYAKWKPLLLGLGVRNVRDGLASASPYPFVLSEMTELSKDGIYFNLLTGTNVTPDQIVNVIKQLPPNAVRTIEGTNEPDVSTPALGATLAAYQKELYTGMKASAYSHIPILMSSVVGDADNVGNMSSYCDYGVLHNYMGGYNPGTYGWGNQHIGGHYGSIDDTLTSVSEMSGNKPIITTENGYGTDIANTGDIPEAIAARYVPRLFLEQYLRGISRTFEYEFLDYTGGTFFEYGLVRADMSVKPSYTALKNMIALLTDTADLGENFSPEKLSVSLSGQTSNVHQALFQKENGHFFLALWVETSGYDLTTKMNIAVPVQAVTVTLGKTFSSAKESTLQDTGAISANNLILSDVSGESKVNISLTDHVTIVEFTP